MSQGNFGSIVVVDDDPEMLSMVHDHLKRSGYQVRAFNSSAEAVKYLSSGGLDALGTELLLTDLRMPEIDGLDLLQQVRRLPNHFPVIIMTAFATVDTAIEGLRRGAFDYITKPFKLNELSLTIERALNFYRLKMQNQVLSAEVRRSWGIQDIVGKSVAMKSIFDLIDRVSSANSSILITGESGSGKEVVARAIHNRSPRAQKPFIAINCTAIPEDLLESELFGHVKGSFTGATGDKKGLFEEADGGTLFLDEIGDMNIGLQAKLLRVLQERTIKPVGSNQLKNIDVRVIAATHKDMKKAIMNGSFREDLYYRLAVIPIVVPPLRHRMEDIPLLAHHFLRKYSAINHGKSLGFTQEALQKLMSMQWPGNVRELENMVERLVVLSHGPQIEAADIPDADQTSPEQFFGQSTSDSPTLQELEKRYMQLILEKVGGKKEKAAQILGINRRTLYRKEREYGFVHDDGTEGEADE
ncbi:MAG: sigma-54-dependent Fis family transcriptional regulator [Bdellovibrionales bacterium]|nr:sigma-54-dependent Fis family transcriptional regulator [Bdellovibrionales bacterium]